NLYRYVRNRPTNATDPSGLVLWSFFVTAGFAAADIYQFSTGRINGTEFGFRLALTGVALAADAASLGAGGGPLIRVATFASRSEVPKGLIRYAAYSSSAVKAARYTV